MPLPLEHQTPSGARGRPARLRAAHVPHQGAGAGLLGCRERPCRPRPWHVWVLRASSLLAGNGHYGQKIPRPCTAPHRTSCARCGASWRQPLGRCPTAGTTGPATSRKPRWGWWRPGSLKCRALSVPPRGCGFVSHPEQILRPSHADLSFFLWAGSASGSGGGREGVRLCSGGGGGTRLLQRAWACARCVLHVGARGMGPNPLTCDHAQVYDGDTPQSQREDIRQRAQVQRATCLLCPRPSLARSSLRSSARSSSDLCIAQVPLLRTVCVCAAHGPLPQTPLRDPAAGRSRADTRATDPAHQPGHAARGHAALAPRLCYPAGTPQASEQAGSARRIKAPWLNTRCAPSSQLNPAASLPFSSQPRSSRHVCPCITPTHTT